MIGLSDMPASEKNNSNNKVVRFGVGSDNGSKAL